MYIHVISYTHRHWGTSATNGDGCMSLSWVQSQLTTKQLKKSVSQPTTEVKDSLIGMNGSYLMFFFILKLFYEQRYTTCYWVTVIVSFILIYLFHICEIICIVCWPARTCAFGGTRVAGLIEIVSVMGTAGRCGGKSTANFTETLKYVSSCWVSITGLVCLLHPE